MTPDQGPRCVEPGGTGDFKDGVRPAVAGHRLQLTSILAEPLVSRGELHWRSAPDRACGEKIGKHRDL